MNRTVRLAVVYGLASVLFPCAIDTTPRFTPFHTPEKFDKDFVRGKLGIIRGTLSYRSELIAWRYLAGLPLNEQEIAAVLAPSGQAGLDETAAWEDSRRITSNTLRFINTSKASRVAPETYYVNCLPDAFTTAAKTLSDRRVAYRVADKDARLVSGWVAAQDQVFENCSSMTPVYPADPDPKWPALAQADRMYQIAAAHFYAEDFAGARERFQAIAHDNDSPWRDTAAYMLGRILVREDSLLRKPGAREQASTLLRQITSTRFRDSALGLADYVEQDPAGTVKSLGEKLAAPHPGPSIAATIHDATFVLTSVRFHGVMAGAERPEPFEWIRALESNDGGPALDRWKQTQALPWLTVALIHAAASGYGTEDLMAAALQVPADSPAFDTVTYHAIRLMIARGESAAARARLDALLARKGQDLASVDNVFRGERMSLATSFDDFLRWAPRLPTGSGELDDDDDPSIAAPILDNDSAGILDGSAPLSKLLEAARSPRLPAWPHKQIATAGWTRSYVLGASAEADAFASILQRAEPSWAADLQTFRNAKGAEKRFAGALLIARHSETTVNVTSEFPRTRDGYGYEDWWCAQAPDEDRSGGPAEAVLSPAERATALDELDRIHDAGSTQVFLAPIIMSWANSHPRDPRVPEALYRLVRITRYGCRNHDGTGAVSKAAFDLLHKRYPDSTWTKQTPYWFD